MAEIHFEFEEHKKAKNLFEELKLIFKTKQLFLNVIKCDLYILACNLILDKQLNLNEFSNAYDDVMKKAKVLGLSLGGRSIGQLEWIIGQIMWSRNDKQFWERCVDIHIRKAYIELSPYKKADEFIKFMS